MAGENGSDVILTSITSKDGWLCWYNSQYEVYKLDAGLYSKGMVIFPKNYSHSSDTNMIPSTPPRSMSSQFETPKKTTLEQPITPAAGARNSTKQRFNLKPSLAPPVSQLQLKSPEYTPRRDSIKRKILEDEEPMGKDNLFGKLSEATEQKLQKSCPGTPSHKIINEHNLEQYLKQDVFEDSENEIEIKHEKLSNPFSSESNLTEQDYKNRHNKLINENPQLQSTISYLNKNGEVVKQKHLSTEEQQHFKPKRLFQDQLDD